MASNNLQLSENPIVSVCIPVHNCQEYIAETITCFIDQTYQAMEIIIVNDGSTDDTLAQISAITDSRLKIITTGNQGASHARNTAFKNATGQYILFFDADDHIESNFVAQQVAKLSGKDNAVVLADWGRFYKNDLSTFKPEVSPDTDMTFKQWIAIYWYNCNPMTNPGRAIIPRKLINSAGLWNEELSLNDDLAFFTRIFLKVDKIIFNKQAHLYYRSGVKGLSGEKSKKAYQSLYRSILLSTQLVLENYKTDKIIMQACANMWQSFIYEVYPYHKELTHLARQHIKQLPSPDLEYQAGGLTGYLVKFTGWKIAKKIKLKLK